VRCRLGHLTFAGEERLVKAVPLWFMQVIIKAFVKTTQTVGFLCWSLLCNLCLTPPTLIAMWQKCSHSDTQFWFLVLICSYILRTFVNSIVKIPQILSLLMLSLTREPRHLCDIQSDFYPDTLGLWGNNRNWGNMLGSWDCAPSRLQWQSPWSGSPESSPSEAWLADCFTAVTGLLMLLEKIFGANFQSLRKNPPRRCLDKTLYIVSTGNDKNAIMVVQQYVIKYLCVVKRTRSRSTLYQSWQRQQLSVSSRQTAVEKLYSYFPGIHWRNCRNRIRSLHFWRSSY